MPSRRAGGDWVKPWSTLDHVLCAVHNCSCILLREWKPGDNNLMTDSERALLAALYECEEIIMLIRGEQ